MRNDTRLPKDAALDTFPKLLLHHAAQNAKKTALRKKEFGIWQTWDWARVAEEVLGFACGLAALGFKRGECLAIMGDISAQLFCAIPAAQCVGGVPVPLHLEAPDDELLFILNQTKSRFIVVQDQEQVDKLLDIKDRCSSLEKIIFVNSRGMKHYTEACLCSYETVKQEGRQFAAGNESCFINEINNGRGSDRAVVLYVVGNDGRSKGVVLTHSSLIGAAASSAEELRLTPKEEVLALLPMSLSHSFLFYFAQPFVVGFCINFPESYDTVITDMREIGPTFCFATPSVYKGISNLITLKMEDAGAVKRAFYNFFVKKVARRTGGVLLDGASVSPLQSLLYNIGKLLVIGPLKNVLGLGRIRIALTADNTVSADLLTFYRSLGINLKQFYGPPEGCLFISLQRDGQIRPASVGVAIQKTEITITDAGEVAFRGPNRFQGYYGEEPSVAASRDGWVRTGDCGLLDHSGELILLGALADRCRLVDGTDVFPAVVESILKSFPCIKEAVVVGHERPFVSALISLDREVVTRWADRHNLVYSGYAELTQQDAVCGLVKSCVEAANELLCSTGQGKLQVRRFLLLPSEINNGALTHEGKVCRSVIAGRYGKLMDMFYTFEEDRQISATHPDAGPKICDVQVAERKTNLEDAA